VDDLYWRPPPPHLLLALQKTEDDFPQETVEVWDENWAVVELYSRNSSQWRAGAAGPFALDYSVFFAAIKAAGMDEEDTMWALRIIEAAALIHLHEKP
jgi:Phage related hypothetical protein (DUF1799)